MKTEAAPDASDAVLTVEELAVYLKVNARTIYRRYRAGELPGVRIGRSIRFPKAVVDAWLRMRAMGWDENRREGLFARMEAFAVREGLREADIAPAVRRHRRKR